MTPTANPLHFASVFWGEHVPFSPAQRRLRMLRLSITDKCNFRCCYCSPEDGVKRAQHDDLLRLERLAEMVRWLTQETGIHRVRLTGGEPLLRRGVVELVQTLSGFPQIDEVTLTTNGALLAEMAPALKAAGLGRVNVSLDSLDEQRFEVITRGGKLRKTLDGIDAALRYGLGPVKINAVLQRSSWERDVPRLLDYALTRQLEVRFIELMRTGTERAWCDSEFISAEEVRAGLHLESFDAETPTNSSAQRLLVGWRGALLTTGWITPRSHPFCARCERLRMDARGRVRRCLMDDTTLDLHGVLATQGQLAAERQFRCFMAGKRPPRAMDNIIPMSQVGG